MGEKRRPPRDGSKTEKYLVRLSKEDVEMLERAAEKMGVSKSEVIRKGISTQFSLAKYSN